MPGFGSESQTPLSAGLSAQPLVTPITPAATPDAVAKLTEAFRSGLITSQDIIDRIGPLGASKRKAEIQLANEVTQPASVDARLQAYKAASEQARLQQLQGAAGIGLVEPESNLKASQIAAAQSLVEPQRELTAQQLSLAAKYMYPQAVLGLVQQRLKPVKTVERINPDGTKFSQDYNDIGEDITPGSPAHKFLTDTAKNVFNMSPGTAALVPPASAATPDVTPGVTPDVTPKNEVVPATAPTIPVDNTGYTPGMGIQTGLSKDYQTPAEIGSDLRKQDAYSLWDKQQAPANSFKTSAQEILNIPEKDQLSGKAKMNALDLSLAENIIKMYDPGAAIREFKWDKLAEGQPYTEKLRNFKAEVQRTGTLTPESRKRLIALGYDTLAASDAAALPHIQLAATRAQATGKPLESVLNPRELSLLRNGPVKPPAGVASGAAQLPPGGKLVNIPGRGTGMLYPGGIFIPQ